MSPAAPANDTLVSAAVVSEKDIVVTVGDVDEFKPSPLRFVVAALLCLSGALNVYILQTYVTIWYADDVTELQIQLSTSLIIH